MSGIKICPICEKYPEEKLVGTRQFKAFECQCGAAGGGPTTTDAIDNWNELVDGRTRIILARIAKHLRIPLDDLIQNKDNNI